MNNLKLREATRKLIKFCDDCGGSIGIGNTLKYNGFEYRVVECSFEKIEAFKIENIKTKETKIISRQTLIQDCKACLGKGYIDELEKYEGKKVYATYTDVCGVTQGGCDNFCDGYSVGIILDGEIVGSEFFDDYNIKLEDFVDGKYINKGDVYEYFEAEIEDIELELNELLEALGKKDITITSLFIDNESYLVLYDTYGVSMKTRIDLKLKPEQQSEEVINKLIEIL